LLAQALKVVESARALGLQPGKAGIYHTSCDPLFIPRAMRELAQSIEAFDLASAHGDDAKAMLGRALRYAAARGIDPREMVAAIGPGRADPAAEAPDVPADEAGQDLEPRPGEIGAPDDPSDLTVGRQARMHGDAVTGKGSDLPPAFAVDPYFPGSDHEETVAAQDVGSDGTEEAHAPKAPRPPDEADERRRKDVAEAQARIQAIRKTEIRLETLAKRHGWTPALKAIDAQLRRAYGALTAVVTTGAPVANVGADAERLLALADKTLRKVEGGVLAEDEEDDLEAAAAFAPR
jgi:hypothetical protein